jgi:hypothetical protein
MKTLLNEQIYYILYFAVIAAVILLTVITK